MNQLNSIISGIFTAADQQVAGFFDWLIGIGVREDTLDIILYGGGFSLLLLIVLGLVGLVKLIQKNRQNTPKKPPKAKSGQEASKKDTAGKAGKAVGPDPRFAIYKKNKAKGQDAEKAAHDVDPGMAALADIERDMLALKELYESGHIDADLYISETRKLYDQAQKHR